jgi:hypothetical protein
VVSQIEGRGGFLTAPFNLMGVIVILNAAGGVFFSPAQ